MTEGDLSGNLESPSGLDLRHASRPEQIDVALRTLGKQLVVTVKDTV